jgi:hypothetical protein
MRARIDEKEYVIWNQRAIINDLIKEIHDILDKLAFYGFVKEDSHE